MKLVYSTALDLAKYLDDEQVGRVTYCLRAYYEMPGTDFGYGPTARTYALTW